MAFSPEKTDRAALFASATKGKGILKKTPIAPEEDRPTPGEPISSKPSIENVSYGPLKEVLIETHKFWDHLCKFDQDIEKAIEQLLEANKHFDLKTRIFPSEGSKNRLSKQIEKLIDEQPQIKLKEKTTRFIDM